MALKNKKLPLLRLLSIEALSSFVHEALMLLVPWYVIRTTGSALWTAAVGFAIMLPYIFGSTSGGVLVEKNGATKTILISESLQVAVLLMLASFMFNASHTIFICLAMFLSAFLNAQSRVARTSLMPIYSRLAKRTLQSANGAREAIIGVSAILGPLCAGVLAAFEEETFVVNILVLVYLGVFTLALSAYQKREYSRIEKSKINIKKSWRYISKRITLRRGMLFSLPLFIVNFSWESVLLPSYIKTNNFDTIFLGALGAAYGLGILSGALLYAFKGQNLKFKTALILNYLASITVLFIFFIPGYKFLVLGTVVLCGVPLGVFNAAAVTFVLTYTKDAFRNITLGLFASMCALVECVSVVLIGISIDVKDLGFTVLMLMGVFAFILLFVLALYKDRRKNSMIKL